MKLVGAEKRFTARPCVDCVSRGAALGTCF